MSPATTLAAQGGHRDNSECDIANKKVTHYRCTDNYTEVESSCLLRISECCTGMLITVGVLNNCNKDTNCNQVTPVQQVIEGYLLSLVTADLVCGVVIIAEFYEPPPAAASSTFHQEDPWIRVVVVFKQGC